MKWHNRNFRGDLYIFPQFHQPLLLKCSWFSLTVPALRTPLFLQMLNWYTVHLPRPSSFSFFSSSACWPSHPGPWALAEASRLGPSFLEQRQCRKYGRQTKNHKELCYDLFSSMIRFWNIRTFLVMTVFNSTKSSLLNFEYLQRFSKPLKIIKPQIKINICS